MTNEAPAASPRSRLVLLREGVTIALTQPVATTVAAVIAAATCLVVFATAGQSAATEAHILHEVDRAGARHLIFTDADGTAGLMAADLAPIAGLAGVDWVVGLGPTYDVRNIALGDAGNPVPARMIYGNLDAVIDVVAGRSPRPGEAIADSASITALGASQPAVSVRGDLGGAGLVGQAEVTAPLAALANGLLVRGTPDPSKPLRTVHVLARTTADVATLRDLVPTLLIADDSAKLAITSPQILVELQLVVDGQLGAGSRRVMIGVLAGGLVLIAATMAGATMGRRRDFGRRRAMGATRSDIVTLVLVHAAVAAGVGTALGTVGGLSGLWLWRGQIPAWDFTFGVTILTLLMALAATLPPALNAAWKDPVLVLRLP